MGIKIIYENKQFSLPQVVATADLIFDSDLTFLRAVVKKEFIQPRLLVNAKILKLQTNLPHFEGALWNIVRQHHIGYYFKQVIHVSHHGPCCITDRQSCALFLCDRVPSWQCRKGTANKLDFKLDADLGEERVAEARNQLQRIFIGFVDGRVLN